MYLGDGMLFVLDKGKPRLVLSQDVERNPGKHPLRPRVGSILGSRQPPGTVKETPSRPTRQRTGQLTAGVKNKMGEGASTVKSSAAAERGRAGQTASKAREPHTAGGGAKASPKVKSDRHKCSSSTGPLTASGTTGRTQGGVKAGPKHPQAADDERPRDGVACLNNKHARLNGVQTSSHDQHTVEAHKVLGRDGHQGGQEISEDRVGQDGTKGEEATLISPPCDNRSNGGLFSELEKPEVPTKASVEAKKTQRRHEPNEQVALTQQQPLTSVRLQSKENMGSVEMVGHHREQHLAIRSSLKLGAVTPMEEGLMVEKREEQRRRWLEELDQQREETSERKRQEKLLLNQNEDHNLWEAHFDSLQRKPSAATPPASIGVSKQREKELSSNMSSAGDASSSCGAHNVGQVSVDHSSKIPTKSSYLRSMTALLDPVQIEEREKKRLKQLEQQKAIEAQLEERRQQKALEKARRRAEEQEDEKRVMTEWNMQHTKYQEDTNQEQQKKLGGDGVKFSVVPQDDRLEEKKYTAAQTNNVDQGDVDPSSRIPTKSSVCVSYLRSMTALLDPVQIEEREKKRLKQLEHQKAIEAQLEERRQQRALEEARRRAEEQEDEKRVMTEWNMLHTKYQEDTNQEQPKKHEEGANESSELSDGRLEEKKETAVRTEAPSPLREDHVQTASNCKKQGGGGHDKMRVPEGGGKDPYEDFFRTDRKKEKKIRPQWNTHRPSQPFVPASERYPVPLQRSRQESRLRRQEELLTQQERNCLSRNGPPAPPPPHHQGAHPSSKSSQSKSGKAQSSSRVVSAATSAEKGRSSPATPHAQSPVLDFIPYVRTDEVINPDPADAHAPHTDSPPADASHGDHRKTQRQQEILRGLAQLRQGLRQKQRELETDLRRHDDQHLLPLTTQRQDEH
ncbi:coiled-coil domain-containing protein 66 isoform X2 [Nerophis ophidion]|uniref:coiled-coil domain-containing protein 66 isoform X2 n=1 Tax=Nerophis ophidion TaxID=159077 RepID=UPI002ADF524A|nr:coiled-coil domain-containing protein 66 isoform X2 [Nerophis ophidion]